LRLHLSHLNLNYLMKAIHQEFTVTYNYGVYFTQSLFSLTNNTFKDALLKDERTDARKVLMVVEKGVACAFPDLINQIKTYFSTNNAYMQLCGEPMLMIGGEASKNDRSLVDKVVNAINDFGVDRHSYVAVIGGGAVIDMVGFATTIAHRGIRLIRIPTTVLAQNDAAVGVKNSINAYGKKNFIGTFTPPYAVINDSDFLIKLDDRDWRCGIAEAVKVALIKDKVFFDKLKADAPKLAARDLSAMQELIYRCAEMHLQHIAGKDPFERGSSRPLDFGHWAAHKLEYLSNYAIRHGEAVAIGIALDCTYSWLKGYLTKAELDEILAVLHAVGFKLFDNHLLAKETDGTLSLIRGLNEFREHLGGRLTIMLLDKIGHGFEINEMDDKKIVEAIHYLEKLK
jgi:3-dehydroquinate synthase